MVARGSEIGQEKKVYQSSRGNLISPVPVDETTKKSTNSRMNLEKDNLFFTHVQALLRKRAANFRRDRKAWMCTTILPSLFVLMGLLVFKFASQDRELDPLKLRVEDYNGGISSSPRNPITVNNVNDVFTCQPGECAYAGGNAPFIISETDEVYFLCGLHANLNSDDREVQCTLDESIEFMDTISEGGVETVKIDASSVETVSCVSLVCVCH